MATAINKGKFLHSHPRMQNQLMVDSDHVIVDKKDWSRAREFIHDMEDLVLDPLAKKPFEPIVYKMDSKPDVLEDDK